MKIKGISTIIKLNGVAPANSTSCSLTIDTELIERAPLTNGKWREYLVGVHGWTAEVGGIADGNYSQWIGKLDSQASMAFLESPTSDILVGNVLIRSVSHDAPVNGMATYKLGLQGTGQLSVSD